MTYSSPDASGTLEFKPNPGQHGTSRIVVTVTDGSTCSITVPVEIIQPSDSLSTTILNFVNITCNGFTNGVAEVQASGGTPGYLYDWQGFNQTMHILNYYFIVFQS